MKYLLLVLLGFGISGCATPGMSPNEFANDFEKMPAGTPLSDLREKFGRPSELNRVSKDNDDYIVVFQRREYKCAVNLVNNLSTSPGMCLVDQRMKEQMEDDSRASTAAAFSGFGSAISDTGKQMQQNRPVNCTSQKDRLGVVHTTCN